MGGGSLKCKNPLKTGFWPHVLRDHLCVRDTTSLKNAVKIQSKKKKKKKKKKQ